jgi:hypothetical protein
VDLDTHVLEMAEPECAAELLADEVVALNVATGIYFSMRGLAAALWHDLAAGRPVEGLAEEAQRLGQLEGSVADFARQLEDHGLMRAAAPRPFAGESATALLLRRGPGAIVFEVYHDMQDLILSDPIHDVDETVGWPARQVNSA